MKETKAYWYDPKSDSKEVTHSERGRRTVNELAEGSKPVLSITPEKKTRQQKSVKESVHVMVSSESMEVKGTDQSSYWPAEPTSTMVSATAS